MGITQAESGPADTGFYRHVLRPTEQDGGERVGSDEARHGWAADHPFDSNFPNVGVWRDGDVRARPYPLSVSVVHAVPVAVVLDDHAYCSDADAARAALNEALLAVRVPARGSQEGAHWTVLVTFAAAAPRAAAVDAAILDDEGGVVARRTLTDRSERACVPLARAVGAWASLVLDASVTRVEDGEGHPTPASFVVARAPELAMRDAADAPAPAQAARRSVELGTMVYVRSGLVRMGVVAGVSPFVSVALTPRWVLRPALLFGRAAGPDESATDQGGGPRHHVGVRADVCRRMPGNYTERRGIEADVCAGVEGGVVTGSAEAPDRPGRLGIGPSANLRGELGGGVALEIRGLVGINVLEFAPTTPLLLGSGELGVSVRLP